MRQRIKILISVFIFFIVFFLIQKTVFYLINTPDVRSISDLGAVLFNGINMDMSTSGYLTAIPGLLLIASIWFNPAIISWIYKYYFGIIVSLLSVIAISDMVVYSYWGFHYDVNVLEYLKKPKEALGSASLIELIVGFISVIVTSILAYQTYRFLIHKQVKKLAVPRSRTKSAIVISLCVGSLFLPIRGGVSAATMNVGNAYFSENMFLNHSAVNPQFGLLYSSFKNQDFAKQFQFFDKEKANRIFEELHKVVSTDSIQSVLNTDRPNIVLVMLESFSGNMITEKYTPNMMRYADEAIVFENLYANGYRTDRGVVAILGGYPSHPDTPIMKYPLKTQNMPSIPMRLKENGYNTQFYYGGDVDFASMRSYLVGSGRIAYKDIMEGNDFPRTSEIRSRWGVLDEYLYEEVLTEINDYNKEEPFLFNLLTLSSHEPFDVPPKKYDEPYPNSLYYADQCLGNFLDSLKQSDKWDNTLVILVADHCMQWEGTGKYIYEPIRYHIPMLWLGGAVKEPLRVDTYASQTDIAATLLSQLGMGYEDFEFSKNIFNPDANHFGLYTYFGGIAMLTSEGHVVYDNDMKEAILQEGDASLEEKAKAYLQNMYLDIDRR